VQEKPAPLFDFQEDQPAAPAISDNIPIVSDVTEEDEKTHELGDALPHFEDEKVPEPDVSADSSSPAEPSQLPRRSGRVRWPDQFLAQHYFAAAQVSSFESISSSALSPSSSSQYKNYFSPESSASAFVYELPVIDVDPDCVSPVVCSMKIPFRTPEARRTKPGLIRSLLPSPNTALDLDEPFDATKVFSENEIAAENEKDMPDSRMVAHLEEWHEPISKEIDGLVKIGALEPVAISDIDKSERERVVSSTLGLKRKRDGRRKARLCARGFEVDRFFREQSNSWSPCPRAVTVRLLISLIFTLSLSCFIADVTQAFVHAELFESVFMSPPILSNRLLLPPGWIWRVRRSIYGLRAAGRNWHKLVCSVIESKLGYVRSSFDDCLFHLAGTYSYILVHVDDFLISGTKLQVESAVRLLKQAFPNSINGSFDLKTYLGFSVADMGSYVILNCEPFIKKCLRKFKISGVAKCCERVRTSVTRPQLSTISRTSLHNSIFLHHQLPSLTTSFHLKAFSHFKSFLHGKFSALVFLEASFPVI
jgi:hypothetical protein